MASIAEFVRMTPSELGVSRPITVDQARIDAFGSATGDDQWIHTDPERAADGPFGTTIAHGFLTLALTSSMVDDVLKVEGTSLTVNYGLERVRFPVPLAAGSVVRGHVELLQVASHPRGARSQVRVTVRAEGEDRPCCVADLVILHSALLEEPGQPNRREKVRA